MQVSPGGLAFRCGPFVTAVVRWFMPQICPKPTAGARSRFMAGHRGCAHEERPDGRPPHGCCNLVVLQISMCGLVAYRPGAGQGEPAAAWMGFDLLEGAYDTAAFIRVLDGLGHQLGHQPVTVIWDNLGAHHAGDLHAWAATQPWLVLAYLPAYAPELDPVEGLTLLYMSSGLGRVLRGHVLEHGEDLASHIALQAPDDLGLGL